MDKDEVRPLADNVNTNKDTVVAISLQFHLLYNASTIGTLWLIQSTQHHLIKATNSVEVDGNQDN